MLTGEYQVNKDFDINNLYLNLTFHNNVETFEYKQPVLDHPSNYQMIVTKFFSKVHFPLLYLHESKKNPKVALQQGDKYYLDYYVKIEYERRGINEGKSVLRTRNFAQNLFIVIPRKLDEGSYKPDFQTKITRDFEDITNSEFIDTGLEYNLLTGQAKSLYWYHLPPTLLVRSAQELVSVLNLGIDAAITRLIDNLQSVQKIDPVFWDMVKDIKNKPAIFFFLEGERMYLYVLEELKDLIACDAFYHANTGADDPIKDSRNVRVGFSENLMQYLKGFPLTMYDGEVRIDIPKKQWATFKKESRKWEDKTLNYYVVEGEKVNLVDWSDFIGVAVTSPDFPVKGQIYPHFVYDTDSMDNRLRYIPDSEDNIEYFTNPFGDQEKVTHWPSEEEDIQEVNKKAVKEAILFVKYFSSSDNLTLFNYENNNTQSALRLDIEKTMPLQKFTLYLWLIDRYNNFTSLDLTKYEFEEIVKMQILFQRIKGTERENRKMIEPIEKPPKPEEPPIKYVQPIELPPEEIDLNALAAMIAPTLGEDIGENHEEEEEENDDDGLMQLFEPALKKIKEEEGEEESKNDLY